MAYTEKVGPWTAILCYAMFPAPQQPNNNKPLGEFWLTMQIF